MNTSTPSLRYKFLLEIPTWALIFGVYGAWAILIAFHLALLPVVWILLMSLVLALFGSLCHELLHGHPSDHQLLSDAIGTPALSFYPYFEYKRSHLKHHDDVYLTKPGIDPESFFIDPIQWRTMNRIQKGLATFNMTLMGRLLFGPLRTYIGLAKCAIADFKSKNTSRKNQWLFYFGNILLISWLLFSYFQVSPGAYLMAVYIGHSLIALRSFYEHQTHADPTHRIVIVDSNLFFGLLFLFNNLHVVHHQHPGLAWYLIPGEYRRNKQKYRQSNGGFNFTGYRNWLKFLFRPVASPVFPPST